MDRKFLMITPFFSPNNGGVETFLDDLIQYLNKHKEYVEVITYQPLTSKAKAPVYEVKNNNKIIRIPWIKLNLFYRLEMFPLLQLIYLGTGIGFLTFFYFLFNKAEKIETINCHGLTAATIGYFLSFFVKKKFVLNLHTNYRFNKKQLIGRYVLAMVRRFDKVLALSKACRMNLIDIGVPEEKVTFYHNWVDNTMYKIEDKEISRKKIGWEKGFYALFVGRFSKEKGIFELLKAIAHLDKNIKLAIIGGGMGENQVIKAAQENEQVYYLGRKTALQLVDYLNAADILVYAPIDEDYLGRTAISALSCGTPIMVPEESLYLGNKRKIAISLPKDIGITFKNEPQVFAKVLNNIYINFEKYSFNRKACREYAEKFYGEQINGKIIYDNLK